MVSHHAGYRVVSGGLWQTGLLLTSLRTLPDDGDLL
jgi:hypothetical protein